MQELVSAIDNFADTTAREAVPVNAELLRDAAKKWASFALDTYSEPFLEPALKVSAALAEFANIYDKTNA